MGACFAFYSAVSVTFPDQNHPLVFYSTHVRGNVKKILCKVIGRAHHTLSLSSYGFSDRDILALLHEKKRANVTITIYHDGKRRWETSTLTALSDVLHTKTTSGLMHRKFVIVDHTLLYLSSANFTEASLTIHDNLTALFHHPLLCRNIEERQPLISSLLDYYPLPCEGKKAIECILEQLHSAKKQIFIAMFTLTHPLLIQELIEAHRRGVKVHLFLDKQTAKGASRTAFARLIEAGITVDCNIGNQLLHYKCAWIDDAILIFGSANWTAAAFEKNDDDLFIVHSLSKKNRRFFRKMFAHIL